MDAEMRSPTSRLLPKGHLVDLRCLSYECGQLEFFSKEPEWRPKHVVLVLFISTSNQCPMTSIFAWNQPEIHSRKKLNRKRLLLWSCFAFITRDMGQNTSTSLPLSQKSRKQPYLKIALKRIASSVLNKIVYIMCVNSPVPEFSFLPAPSIGAEPGRAKRESRKTCMCMLRMWPFFPQIGGKIIFGSTFQIRLVGRFSNNNMQTTIKA